MGLFSKRKREPVVHPDVARRIHVRLDAATVVSRMEAYSRIAGPIEPTPVHVDHVDGWTTVVITGSVHPQAVHNLAHWIMERRDAPIVLTVDAGTGRSGYWLVPDADFDDWWIGYTDDATPITVSVPDNVWVAGDHHSEPSGNSHDALARLEVPEAAAATTGSATHAVRLEDSGSALNPTNEATMPSRSALAVPRNV